MVLLSGHGKWWVNLLEQGKPEWRDWHAEWAGVWKKQQLPELGEVSAPHRPWESGVVGSIMFLVGWDPCP